MARSNRTHFLAHSLAVCLLAAACTGEHRDQAQRSLPPPGQSQRMQVLIVAAEDAPLGLKGWGGLDPLDFEEAFQARVEKKLVQNKESAKDIYLQYSGRPMDLIVLGPGIPLEAWSEVKVTRSERRLTLALVEGQALPAAWRGEKPHILRVDETRVAALKKEVCREAKDCEHLVVSVLWKEAYSRLMDAFRKEKLDQTRDSVFSFHSTFLSAQWGAAEPGLQVAIPDGARRRLQDFLLKELRL